MKVSWDDNIPNIWKLIKIMFQSIPKHQPDNYQLLYQGNYDENLK